jgi:hypothetical protein
MKSLYKCAQHVHHKEMSHQQKRSLLQETGGSVAGPAGTSGGGSYVTVSEWCRASGISHCQWSNIMSVTTLVGYGSVTLAVHR